MKDSRIKSKLLIILLFIVLILLVLLINIKDDRIVINDNSKLYISEIMANNKSTIKDSDNEYSDYIEIYNDYDQDINLKNYYLSDETTSSKKWIFPEIIIKSKEYLIIYASDKNKCDLSIRECHTNFKLGNNGETVTLLDNKRLILSKVKYPELSRDESYSLIKNKYKLTTGTPNTANIDLAYNLSTEKDIIINEVTASRNPEEIELKNNTDRDIDLSSYSIHDKSGTKYNFENITIKANSFLVIYGSDKPDIVDNKIYTGFKINNHSDILYLYKNNVLVDTFNVGKITSNVSKGRNKDLEIVLYKEITIGKENSSKYYLGYSKTPTFNIDGGYIDKGTKIELTTNEDSIIYYTLDGSIPTNKSKKYTEPITINNNTVIKSITYKDNYIESDVESRTYFTGRKHDLPVISISSNNNNLFGNNGILTKGNNASSYYPYFGANFWKDIKIPISFEYYENGKLGISFNAGMEIYGNWSRGEAQKSLDIILREKYGQSEITYPFFENNINTFKDLVLRNSGQDYGKTKLKDAFLHEVLEGQMDIDKQDSKPAIVYINGKYYGIYNIREKTNKNYIENHHDAKNKNIDLIKSKRTPIEGTIDEYVKLLNYVKNNDMRTDEAYKYLDNQIDLQELINYFVVETYYGNTDPGNMKFYKIEGGKWRWILFDLDNTFHISPSNSSYTSTIRWELPFSDYVPGHDYTLDSTIMKNIIKNPKIREMYIKTWAKHLKTTFKPERMNKILEQMVKEIENEMPYHIDRWYQESIYTSRFTITSISDWRNNIAELKYYIKARHQNALKTIKEGLGLTQEEYDKYFKDL